MSKPIEFPELPRDPFTLITLGGFKNLATKIRLENPDNEELTHIAAYLYIIADAPIEAPYVYFLFHQHMVGECDKMTKYYNHYIFSRGNEYMLEVANREVGSFGQYFNDFQLLMYNINKLAKEDPSYAPINSLLWGIYCAFYDTNKRKKYLEHAHQFFLKQAEDEAKGMFN